MLREIKELIVAGKIAEGSDFARKLASLARKADKDIISAFEASCDGEFFNPATFDASFFIDQAKDIIAERAADESKN